MTLTPREQMIRYIEQHDDYVVLPVDEATDRGPIVVSAWNPETGSFDRFEVYPTWRAIRRWLGY